MAYENLFFFTKEGKPCNFTYTNGLWGGSIHLPRVSVGLFEVESLFIVEKFIDTATGKIVYAKPHTGNPNVTTGYTVETGDINELRFQWEDDNTEKIFLYQFDVTEETPYIETYAQIDVILDVDYNESIDTSGLKSTTVLTDEQIQINIAISSDVEDIYERYLLITDNNTGTDIARIQIYGETVAEDERLSILCNNLGYDFLTKDVSLFKDSDMNEGKPDFEILNYKKKEILLEGSNIIPYRGSYKGLINSIKYYGYNNLVIKEYWKNVNIDSPRYGKYKSTKVIDIFDDRVDYNNDSTNMPNKNFKKTSLFGLYYRINKIRDGLFDQHDLPLVEEVFEYTLEEALIKLYGLKNKLKEDFLSSNSRILDISGESDYFHKSKIRANLAISVTDVIDVGIDATFTVIPDTYGYIMDLRDITDLDVPEQTPWSVPHIFSQVIADSSHTVETLASVLLAYWDNYYPNLDTLDELPDKEGISVGYPIVLQNTSFNITWDETNVVWRDLDSNANHIYDFVPKNPSVNDIFRIRDKISGEYVQHVALGGDGALEIAEALVTAWYAAMTSDGAPWDKFHPSVVGLDPGEDPTFRIKGLEVAGQQVQFDFESLTIDASFPNDSELTKYTFSLSTLYTWDNLESNNFYDIEWIVYKAEDTTPEFSYTVRGQLYEYNELPLNLPHEGIYTVEMKLYDAFNNVSSETKTDYIEVKSKEIDFKGYYRYIDRNYIWNNVKNDVWNDCNSYWNLPLINNTEISNIDMSWYIAGDRSNLIPLMDKTNPDTSVTIYTKDLDINFAGPYQWVNMNTVIWDDSTHLWWDATEIAGDSPAYFQILDVYRQGQLEIYDGTDTGYHQFLSFDIENAKDELNTSVDPIISKYNYNCIYDELDDPQYILAVGKYMGKGCDFEYVAGSTGDVLIGVYGNSITNNIRWNEINVLHNYAKLSPASFITFTYDNCKIPGKTDPIWTVTNLDDIAFGTKIYKQKILPLLFKIKGKYSVDLQLNDTNGNTKNLNKNILIIE